MKKIFLLVTISFCLVSFQKAGDKNLVVVSNYLDLLFKKGDFISMKKIIANDAMYTQAQGLPYGGVYKGFEQWVQMFTKVQTYFTVQLTTEPLLFSNHGNKVAANFTVKFTSKKTNEEITMSVIELFELKEGMIISITPYYFDTKAIADFIKEK